MPIKRKIGGLQLDEMLSPVIAIRLRELGYDAVSVIERGTQGADDAYQMDYAARDKRAVVTYNISDFTALVADYGFRQLPHYGVIFVSSASIRHSDKGALICSLSALCTECADEDSLKNQCHFLSNPSPTP